MKLAAIVLAAGASTRLGQPKQLYNFEGVPLARHAARTALSVTQSVFVVLGCDVARIAATLDDLPVAIVIAGDWAEGLAASLRAGIAAAGAADAALILLCDQPLVTPAHLEAMLDAFEPGGIVATDLGDALGPPCVLDRAFFPEILALTGDVGARGLLRKYPGRSVWFPDARVDIDTVADIETLANRRRLSP